ncbi:MAG: nicotinate-nucleotide adenylyltransferase [Chloroflexota bacterium]
MGVIRHQPVVVQDERAIGILGGTFDPIHEGHLALAREARSELGLETVLFVPNADPPHKQDQSVSEARQREAMVAAAIAAEPGFVLSRIELERAGPSYAVDTVAELAAQSRANGQPEPWFILSAEALREFDTWRDPVGILRLCRIAVAPRPGAAAQDRAWLTRHYPGYEDRFTFLSGPQLDIASTAIRERVAAGQSIDRLVPDAVRSYIAEHGLYSRNDAEQNDAAPNHVEEDGPDLDEQPPAAETATEEATSAADPREAERPGLPSTRHTSSDEEGPRLSIIAGAVDESVLALAHRIVDLAADKKASDIVLLDVRGQTTMTDYFVICSGASDRQLNAIASGIEEGAKEAGAVPISREGDASSHWLLVDYGGVIVHVMSGPERDFYQLEKLWSDAALLLRVL